MFPLLTIFVALMLGLAYPWLTRVPRPADLPGTVLLVLLSALLTALLARSTARRIREGDAPAAALARVGATARILWVAAYAVVIYGCHWPAVIGALGISGWILLDEVVILLPFAVMLVLGTLALWRVESRLGLHDFSPGEYLAFHLQQVLVPLVPFFFFVLLRDLAGVGSRAGIRWAGEALIHYESLPFVQWLTLGSVLLLLYCLLPFFVRWMWRARPLEPGPLRERLREFSERERFRARDILVWPTGGNLLNAAVIGVAAPFRYVLLTDALIRDLPEDEVEAVFAHEVGHAKHGHMLKYFLFTIGYALLAFFASHLLSSYLPAGRMDPALVYLLFTVVTFLVWFGTLFGFVSRRFEQQADVYAALATERLRGPPPDGPESHAFVRALEGLALQMGDLREVKGWRHFSLGERIEFLKRFLSDPGTRRNYRRGILGLMVFFFGLLLLLGVGGAASVPDQLRRGRLAVTLRRADWFRQAGRPDDAVRESLNALRHASPRAVAVATGAIRGDEVDDREVGARLLEAGGPYGDPWLRALHLTLLSRAYLALDLPSAGRDAAQDAWRLAGDHPEILTLLGRALLLEGRTRGSRLAFADALRALPEGDPRRRQARERVAAVERTGKLFERGRALEQLGRSREAGECFTTVERITAAAGIGLTVRHVGRADLLELLRLAREVRLTPRLRSTALLAMARVRLERGEAALARGAALEARLLAGDGPLSLALTGEALLLEGRLAGARMAFTDALERSSGAGPLADLIRARLAELSER